MAKGGWLMGIHICVDHPKWDSNRYGYDNDFLDIIASIECEEVDIELNFRPSLLNLRQKLNNWNIDKYNKIRYWRLYKILKDNKDISMHVSY